MLLVRARRDEVEAADAEPLVQGPRRWRDSLRDFVKLTLNQDAGWFHRTVAGIRERRHLRLRGAIRQEKGRRSGRQSLHWNATLGGYETDLSRKII